MISFRQNERGRNIRTNAVHSPGESRFLHYQWVPEESRWVLYRQETIKHNVTPITPAHRHSDVMGQWAWR